MEPKLSLLLCLCLIAAVAAEDPQPAAPAQNRSRPHLTGCFSRELVTFRCHWDAGSYQNLTEPGDLRLYYKMDNFKKKGEEWLECPSYSTAVKNECYFNESHTRIWFQYSIQMRSQNQDIYDAMFFSVEEIVFPDPPEAMNWTLLSLSPSGLTSDVLVSWIPPSSATESLNMGWINLQYQTQFRKQGSDEWLWLKDQKETEAYLYGLQSNTAYEVRVRSKMRGYNYGEFSDHILIFVPSEESRIPLAAVLILSISVMAIILMLIVISYQQKLMVILLPPVPGPKIKGISSDFLKKGKMVDFTSILGAHPTLRPEFYSSDSWVEFIEVDLDDPIEVMDDFGAPLIFSSSGVSDSPPTLGSFQDDDSGRASCCDPDLSDHDQHEVNHPSTSTQDDFHPLSSAVTGGTPPATQESTWPISVYSQVTEVMPGGKTLLASEVHTQVMEGCKRKDKTNKDDELLKMHLVMIPDERGYTKDLEVPKNNTSAREEQRESSASEMLSEAAFSIQTMPTPPPEYTVVDGVDWNNSLFLWNPPTAAIKATPSPEEYLTAELLHKITP